MGRMRGIIEEPTGLRYVPSLLSEDQGRDLLERVRGLEFDEVRMQAAKYCHGTTRSNSDRPATLAKSADVAKRGRPSVGGPSTGPVIVHGATGECVQLSGSPWLIRATAPCA
jgi:hypothetical protein